MNPPQQNPPICAGCKQPILGTCVHMNLLGTDYYFHLHKEGDDCYLKWLNRRSKL